MKSSEFDAAIASGRKLVILDEMVLDVEKFIDQHPGGRFVLQHNIGRDVSKFFHGGYSLEGNMGRGAPAQGYMHSTFARKIVNDLAIASYAPHMTVSTTICRVREDLCVEVSPNTKTIVFENVDGATVPNFKSHFPSISYAAKHFLIRSLEGPNAIARHYTICNAMNPEIYRAYIDALRADNDPEKRQFDFSILEEESQDKMMFCIKNYSNPKGLSTKIHEQPQQQDQRFEVKGPMGHGL